MKSGAARRRAASDSTDSSEVIVGERGVILARPLKV